MNQNPFEGNQQEIQENPEVEMFCASLVHHLSHFTLILSLKGTYDGFEHLKQAKEFIVKLLNVSKNPLLIACLQRLQEKLDGINEGAVPDITLTKTIGEIYDPISSHALKQY